MKIIIERGKRKYEAVPCGQQCSFAKQDAHGEESTILNKWERNHCTKRCYLPKWWYDRGIYSAEGAHNLYGLREIGGAK